MVSALVSIKDCAWDTSAPNRALNFSGSTLARRSWIDNQRFELKLDKDEGNIIILFTDTEINEIFKMYLSELIDLPVWRTSQQRCGAAGVGLDRRLWTVLPPGGT